MRGSETCDQGLIGGGKGTDKGETVVVLSALSEASLWAIPPLLDQSSRLVQNNQEYLVFCLFS